MSEKTSQPVALYDEQSDVAYFRFRPGHSVMTRILEWGGSADVDEGGDMVAARVFFASTELPREILDKLPRAEVKGGRRGRLSLLAGTQPRA